MPVAEATPRAFSYAMLRVVPRVDRGERLNVAVVLFCRQMEYLELREHVDDARLASLDATLDTALVRSRLAALRRVASGDPTCGPIAELPQSERFGWIVAASSTVIQPSATHTGLTEDPAATLARLFVELVG